MGTTIVVTVDNIAEIIKQMHKACADIAAQAAQDIADEYSATAPVRSGFMASSAYVETKESSTYGSLVGGADGPMLPEVDKPDDDTTAYAAVAAEYACYVELGTIHMAAQPAFLPAVDKAAATFADELRTLEKRIKVRGAK